MRYLLLGSKGFIGERIIEYFKKKKIQFIEYKKISELIPSQIKKKDIIINCLGKNINKADTHELKNKIQLIKRSRKKILWIQKFRIFCC